MKKAEDQIEIYTKFFHGLSNPTRYKIIISLIEGEKSVGELSEDLGCSQSLVSMQLKCLKWCNFVTSTKQGKNIYYSIADSRIISLLQLGEAIADGNIERICTCDILESEREDFKTKESQMSCCKENNCGVK